MSLSRNGSERTVLVIGATGRHGGTGARVAQELRERDYPVRVLARTDGPHLEDLRARGAEVAFGDLLDRRTLGAAIDGVDAVYFSYPIAAGAIPAAANLASVLREAELSPRMVVMSMGPAAPDSTSALGRAQWVAEDLLSWADLKPTVLRITALFYENVAVLHGESISATGGFSNNFGAARLPWISGRDAADLAIAALTEPTDDRAGTVSHSSGAEFLTHGEIAEIIAREIGRPVRYDIVSTDQWRAELNARSDRAGSVINTAMAQHISSIGARYFTLEHSSPFEPDRRALTTALGHEPMSFAEFVHGHRDAFAGQ